MKTHLTKLLGGALLAGAAFGASGQNFYDEEPVGPIYFSVEAGGLLMQDFRLTSFGGTRLDSKTSNDVGYRFDVIGGYQFHKNWSVELDLGVTWNKVDKVGGQSVSPDRFELWQDPLILDFIYTLPLSGPWSVYVGGGAGGVFTSVDYDLTNFGHIQDTDAAFGYQGLAGVNYAINDRMDVGIVYKFLGTSNHTWEDRGVQITTGPIMSHAIMAAFTMKF